MFYFEGLNPNINFILQGYCIYPMAKRDEYMD